MPWPTCAYAPPPSLFGFLRSSSPRAIGPGRGPGSRSGEVPPDCGTLPRVLTRDRALLDAFRRGERTVLTAVFRAYVDDVARTIRAGVVVQVEGQRVRVGQQLPEHEVEGLIQETFLRAFSEKARGSYDGLRPYGGWLATIARNLVIDLERKRRRAPVDAVGEVESQVVDESADPATMLEEDEASRVLLGVKASLGEPELTIFTLRFEEQQSCRAIADALGTTEIVVRRRETQLRARLLEELRAAGFLKNATIRIGQRLLRRREG